AGRFVGTGQFAPTEIGPLVRTVVAHRVERTSHIENPYGSLAQLHNTPRPQRKLSHGSKAQGRFGGGGRAHEDTSCSAVSRASAFLRNSARSLSRKLRRFISAAVCPGRILNGLSKSQCG